MTWAYFWPSLNNWLTWVIFYLIPNKIFFWPDRIIDLKVDPEKAGQTLAPKILPNSRDGPWLNPSIILTLSRLEANLSLTKVHFDPIRSNFFGTEEKKIGKFGIRSGNFPNPNQRWLTWQEHQKNFDLNSSLPNSTKGQTFWAQTHL